MSTIDPQSPEVIPVATKQRRRFAELSSRAYEHPADRAALSAMRKVPGFDMLLRRLSSLIGERRIHQAFLGSAVRVNARQFARIHAIFVECCEILDISPIPELFVAQTPILNAGAIGIDNPVVIVTSGALEVHDPEALYFILGHELGHILSGHALYRTLLAVLLRFSFSRLGIPVGDIALRALHVAMLEWSRKAELSCDRAGLLCLQRPNLAYEIFMRNAGGGRVQEMNVDEFMRQAEEYESSGTVLDGLARLLNLMGTSHPFWALRTAELKRWVDRGDYQKIYDGDYRKRSSDSEESVREAAAESAQSYKESASESKDPLVQAVLGFGAQIAETGNKMWSTIKSKFSKAEKDVVEEGDEAAPPAEGDEDNK
jgi:Zn-dependent protease with chaperone function